MSRLSIFRHAEADPVFPMMLVIPHLKKKKKEKTLLPPPVWQPQPSNWLLSGASDSLLCISIRGSSVDLRYASRLLVSHGKRDCCFSCRERRGVPGHALSGRPVGISTAQCSH